jgi:glucose-1-phosphate cytidylyltransferase
MQVVILCGGKGSRSYPFTDLYPKVMMPIGGRPILIHLMEIYVKQGFTNFILAAGHRQEILRDYFERKNPDWNVQIVNTGADADTGERIRQCAPLLGDRFFATYGDGLSDINLAELLAQHEQSGGIATVTAVPLRSQYGTLEFDSTGQVRQFKEKPVIENFWINGGFFVFEKTVFDHWEGRNLEVDILPKLATKHQLFTYIHNGFWKSMDTSKDQQELEKLFDLNQAPWLHAPNPHEINIPTFQGVQNEWPQ